MTNYEPELGQACFGQPYQQYGCPALVYGVLSQIGEELDRIMWNIHQKKYDSPFGNTANKFKCDVFEVEAYSWNDDVEQEFNFKWRDVKISWYKYLGRGMSCNQKLSPDKTSEMLEDCLRALSDYEKKHEKEV